MSAQPVSLSDYRSLVGSPLGTSPWFVIDQQRIDRFAHVTEDEQFIHVDPVAAAVTPFGGTIAHGFLSLSMLSAMANATVPVIDGAVMHVNYGLNSVRFLQPVGSGKRVRAVFVLKDVQQRKLGQWQSTFGVTVEIEGVDKPALIAEWLALAFMPPPTTA